VDSNTLCHGLAIVSYWDSEKFVSDDHQEMSNLPETTGPPMDFDPLLVSEYITEHLYPSQLDAFFDGTLASDSNPPSLKVAPTLHPGNMKELLSQAKEALESVKKGKKVEIVSHSLLISPDPA